MKMFVSHTIGLGSAISNDVGSLIRRRRQADWQLKSLSSWWYVAIQQHGDKNNNNNKYPIGSLKTTLVGNSLSNREDLGEGYALCEL